MAYTTPNTSRRKGTSENISTYGTSGYDYSVLATWETATDNDLVTATQSEVLECYKGAYTDTDTFDGATCNSSYFRIIRPAGTINSHDWQGHKGVPKSDGTCVEFNSTGSAAFVLRVNENYFSFQDLVVKHAPNLTSNTFALRLNGSSNLAVGCIVYDCTNSGSGYAYGFQSDDTNYFVNCIAHNVDHDGFYNNSNSYYYNCSSYDCNDDGFDSDGGAPTAKNCMSESNSSNQWEGVWTKTTCSDGDAPTVRDATNDCFEPTVADTTLFGQGTDLSADANFDFDDDILGRLRTYWSIGAFDGNLSSRRRGVNEQISTYDSAGGRDYSTLSGWEAATDDVLTTSKESEVLECYANAHEDYVELAGATCSDTYFRIIRPAGTIGESDWQGHEGIPKSDGSCVEFNHSTCDKIFKLSESYAQIQDVVAKWSGNISSYNQTLYYIAATNTYIIGCLGYDSNNSDSSYHASGFKSEGAYTAYFINCLFSNMEADGCYLASTGTYYVYNCTIDGCGSDGLQRGGTSATINAKNTISTDNVTNDWNGTFSKTTCTAEDATCTYNDSTNDDFRLSSSDTTALDQGTDLSGDSVFPFDDDILGTKRGATWSIGFAEEGVSTETTTVSSDLVALFDLLNTIYSGSTAKFGVFNNTYSTLTGKFNLLNTINTSLTLKYGIQNRIQSDSILAYQIFNRLTSALTCVYASQGRVNSDLVALYDVCDIISSDSTLVYDILNATISSDLTCVYDAFNSVTSDIIAKFDVANLVQSDVTGKYDVLATVASDLIFLQDILALVQSDAQLLYDIKERIVTDVDFIYDSAGKVRSDLDILYRIGGGYRRRREVWLR